MDHRKSEWQLVFFTILTQMAVGTFTCWGLTVLLGPKPSQFSEGVYPSVLLTLVLGFLVFGTISAGLHLGRPARALFSISNLQSSWLSREALLGSSFGLVVFIELVRCLQGALISILDGFFILVGIILGLFLVYSISRLYRLRTVPAWNNPGTPATFFTTTFLLGVVAATMLWFLLTYWGVIYEMDRVVSNLAPIAALLILLLPGVQLGIFIFQVLYLYAQGGAAADSIRLLWSDLRAILTWRSSSAFTGVAILAINLFIGLPLGFSFLAFILILVSEILGRFLFYGFYQREGF